MLDSFVCLLLITVDSKSQDVLKPLYTTVDSTVLHLFLAILIDALPTVYLWGDNWSAIHSKTSVIYFKTKKLAVFVWLGLSAQVWYQNFQLQVKNSLQ